MSLTANVLRAGSNNFQTPADGVGKTDYWFYTQGVPPIGSIGLSTNQKTGDFAVQAQGTPNKTVKIKSGKMLMKATPTSESERMFAVELSADYNLTIADNATGSTKYDKILLVLDADDLHEPPGSGDLTEVACLITERHNAANEAVTATNAIELAEITVANGFSSLADTVIAEKRKYAGEKFTDGWTNVEENLGCSADNNLVGSAALMSNLEIGDKFSALDDGVQIYGYVIAKPSGVRRTFVCATATGEAATLAINSTVTNARFSKASTPAGFPDWFNWTPTFAGFSADPTGVHRFKVDGRTVTVSVSENGNGTSNGTNFTISAPIKSANITNMYWYGYPVLYDNGALSTTRDWAAIGPNQSVITLNKNASPSGFTNSGNKRAYFDMYYEM